MRKMQGLDSLNFLDAQYITCELTFHILDPVFQIGTSLWVFGIIFTNTGSSRVGLSIAVLVRRDIYTVTKGCADPGLGSKPRALRWRRSKPELRC